MHARNAGVNMVFIHALSENAPMLKIARNAGASVERDGSADVTDRDRGGQLT
jgi:hypothetical protein